MLRAPMDSPLPTFLIFCAKPMTPQDAVITVTPAMNMAWFSASTGRMHAPAMACAVFRKQKRKRPRTSSKSSRNYSVAKLPIYPIRSHLENNNEKTHHSVGVHHAPDDIFPGLFSGPIRG